MSWLCGSLLVDIAKARVSLGWICPSVGMNDFVGWHMVTPGITGWAQINYPYGNCIEDVRQKMMYDFYSVKNRCVILDLMIFCGRSGLF